MDQAGFNIFAISISPTYTVFRMLMSDAEASLVFSLPAWKLG
jgi:hypothetical protein